MTPIPAPQRQAPLTAKDLEKLKATKGGGFGCFAIAAVGCVLVSGFLFVLANDVFSDGLLDLPPGVIVIPFSLIFIALAFYLFRRYSGRAQKDIRSGVKTIVTSHVTRKFTEDLDPTKRTKFANTTAFMVEIAGTVYDVREEDHSKFSEGMAVEVHTGVHSRQFLGIYDAGNAHLLSEELL